MDTLQTLIILHLIEKFKLHDCLLNEEDSWNFQYPGETDRKLSDVFLEDLAMEVYHGGCSYLEAKLQIDNLLMECSFDKDILLLKKLLNQLYMPVIFLRNIRDELIYFHFDYYIIKRIRDGIFSRKECHHKDPQISTRLKRAIAKHNKQCVDLKWLESFVHWPQENNEYYPLNYGIAECPQEFV